MYFEQETDVEESVEAYVKALLCMTSRFRREVDKNRALLGYYAASSNFLQTFRDNLSFPSSGRGIPCPVITQKERRSSNVRQCTSETTQSIISSRLPILYLFGVLSLFRPA